MHSNCKDFRYNDYTQEMCYDVSHMINDVHKRLLQTNVQTTQREIMMQNDLQTQNSVLPVEYK